MVNKKDFRKSPLLTINNRFSRYYPSIIASKQHYVKHTIKQKSPSLEGD